MCVCVVDEAARYCIALLCTSLTGSDETRFLGFLNHAFADTILDTVAGFHALKLEENGGVAVHS